MSDANTYDVKVRAIHAYNQPILDDFRAWLKQSGLAEKTVKNHVDNIDFFTKYLVYYEPLNKPANYLSLPNTFRTMVTTRVHTPSPSLL